MSNLKEACYEVFEAAKACTKPNFEKDIVDALEEAGILEIVMKEAMSRTKSGPASTSGSGSGSGSSVGGFGGGRRRTTQEAEAEEAEEEEESMEISLPKKRKTQKKAKTNEISVEIYSNNLTNLIKTLSSPVGQNISIPLHNLRPTEDKESCIQQVKTYLALEKVSLETKILGKLGEIVAICYYFMQVTIMKRNFPDLVKKMIEDQVITQGKHTNMMQLGERLFRLFLEYKVSAIPLSLSLPLSKIKYSSMEDYKKVEKLFKATFDNSTLTSELRDFQLHADFYKYIGADYFEHIRSFKVREDAPQLLRSKPFSFSK